MSIKISLAVSLSWVHLSFIHQGLNAAVAMTWNNIAVFVLGIIKLHAVARLKMDKIRHFPGTIMLSL